MSIISQKLAVKTKFILMVFLTSLSVLLVENSVFIIKKRIDAKQELIRDTQSFARIISNYSAKSLLQNDIKTEQEILDILKIDKAIVSACIYDAKGNFFARYDSGEERPFEFPAVENLPIEAKIENDYLHLSEPVVSNGAIIGNVMIRASLRELNLHWYNYLLYRFLMIFFSGLVLYLITLRLERNISKPLQRLILTSHAIVVNKNYRMRVTVENEDDFGALARVFNEMIEAVETSERALRESNERLATFEQAKDYPADLLALASLHVGAGIEHIGGNVEAYRKQLHRFRQHFAHAPQEIHHVLFEEKDILSATVYFNALRGVAGNIGATSLYRCVMQLSKNLKENHIPDASDLEKMNDLLQEVFTDIDSLTLTEKNQNLARKEDFSPAKLLATATALLNTFDHDLGASEALLDELCTLASGSEFESLAEAIAIQLDEFNIERATMLLNDLTHRLNNAS